VLENEKLQYLWEMYAEDCKDRKLKTSIKGFLVWLEDEDIEVDLT
jgi:hypothetical protein